MVSLPVAMTSRPSSGRIERRPEIPRQQTPSIKADSSLRVMYRWPDAACLKPEISPRTLTWENESSTVRFSKWDNSETEYSGKFLVAVVEFLAILIMGL